jgi:hypothetical protein
VILVRRSDTAIAVSTEHVTPAKLLTLIGLCSLWPSQLKRGESLWIGLRPNLKNGAGVSVVSLGGGA